MISQVQVFIGGSNGRSIVPPLREIYMEFHTLLKKIGALNCIMIVAKFSVIKMQVDEKYDSLMNFILINCIQESIPVVCVPTAP